MSALADLLAVMKEEWRETFMPSYANWSDYEGEPKFYRYFLGVPSKHKMFINYLKWFFYLAGGFAFILAKNCFKVLTQYSSALAVRGLQALERALSNRQSLLHKIARSVVFLFRLLATAAHFLIRMLLSPLANATFFLRDSSGRSSGKRLIGSLALMTISMIAIVLITEMFIIPFVASFLMLKLGGTSASMDDLLGFCDLAAFISRMSQLTSVWTDIRIKHDVLINFRQRWAPFFQRQQAMQSADVLSYDKIRMQTSPFFDFDPNETTCAETGAKLSKSRVSPEVKIVVKLPKNKGYVLLGKEGDDFMKNAPPNSHFSTVLVLQKTCPGYQIVYSKKTRGYLLIASNQNPSELTEQAIADATLPTVFEYLQNEFEEGYECPITGEALYKVSEDEQDPKKIACRSRVHGHVFSRDAIERSLRDRPKNPMNGETAYLIDFKDIRKPVVRKAITNLEKEGPPPPSSAPVNNPHRLYQPRIVTRHSDASSQLSNKQEVSVSFRS